MNLRLRLICVLAFAASCGPRGIASATSSSVHLGVMLGVESWLKTESPEANWQKIASDIGGSSEEGFWSSRTRFDASAELVGEIAPEEREALILRVEKLLVELPAQLGAGGIGLERAGASKSSRTVHYSMTGIEGRISLEFDETLEGLMRLQFNCAEVHDERSALVSSTPEIGPIR